MQNVRMLKAVPKHLEVYLVFLGEWRSVYV